ncbi:hypothetical protein CFP65_0959 [Kitasatospora sp. MMS16-BH015]|uniref:hypothetical protein n=1 Tax=Kitasatospora sp. MMS16-BH015 TaxID=2018025 RepID=UPI000CA20EC7|nr:hypothetical protein [Kitasatospora sp. MMS16-BH015]AUG75878.1 hypothetical protein CFP65_0959 [Kitasatospora sp. MMS16-BH015]
MTLDQRIHTHEFPVPDHPPIETPECESSTGHGISTPESVELHTAWPGWIPLLVIAVMVVSCVGFAVGRIAGW